MEFVQVERPESLLPILVSRLPKSGHTYNMVLVSAKFPKEMQIYTLNGEISEKSCIVIVNLREDYSQEMHVSAPDDFEITEEIKTLFATSPIFDWDKMYMIAAVERRLTPMFLEISSFVKGNATSINPCYFYTISPEDAAKLEIQDIPNTQVKSLEKTSGVEFLCRTWKYKMAGSEEYIRRLIEKTETLGVYVDEKVVCGIVVNTNGLLGMLYTDGEHRQKGYGKTCFQSLMKKCANNGIIPCSTVEIRNKIAAKFHETVGMKASHIVDFVIFYASGF